MLANQLTPMSPVSGRAANVRRAFACSAEPTHSDAANKNVTWKAPKTNRKIRFLSQKINIDTKLPLAF